MQYDYIIVGAGSSGCAVAEGLSRNGQYQVLLLEAGGENRHPYVSMPRGWVKLWQNPKYFWSFPIEPQENKPGKETWAYGKGLGGSSAVNGTMYFRGQAADYDAWQKFGNSEWSWDQMRRVFQEMEDFNGPHPDLSRGKGGPVQVSELYDDQPITLATIEAAKQMGLPYLEDVNGEQRTGIGFSQTTVDRHGRRVTAYTAFLKKVRHRPNLTIRTKALVQRVTFDGKQATGVEIETDGVREQIEARQSVVICSGVMNSPKLLQLSGIGPRSLLERRGIPVVADLPAVGQNMADHIIVSFAHRLRNSFGINREFRGWRMIKNGLRYYLTGKGVMAAATVELIANLPLGGGDVNWPDAQLAVSPYSFSAAKPGAKEEPGRGVPDEMPGITLSGTMLRGRSRGSVEIRSRNAADAPTVHANWLTDEQDRRDIVQLVRAIKTLIKQPALASYIGEEVFPGDPPDQTDEQILQSVLANMSYGLHGTGTCRIGSIEDSVVDARLRVHGVEGLRVVDCSVMPTQISGNTNGPAMAVGRRAVELILEDAKPGSGTPDNRKRLLLQPMGTTGWL